MNICLVVEDLLSEYTVRKILSEVRPDLTVKTVYKNGGFGYIKSNVKKFWKASQHIPFVVLADLDNEICAPSRVLNWLGFIPSTGRFVFRIAVHETESWLMADRGSFSDFLGISERLVPKDPDILLDPKEKLLSLVKRSRKRSLKEDILPSAGKHVTVGPAYNSSLAKYVLEFWNPQRAAECSNSLEKAIRALESLQ